MSESKKIEKLSLIFADSIMTDDVVSINQKMTIGQVAHLMLRERVSGYPVVGEDGKLTGIITMTDLFILIEKLSENNDKDFSTLITENKDRPISEIMSKDIHGIKPDTPISDVVKMVAEKNIHTFPVMQGDELVGILGRRDILNAVFVYG